MSEGEETREPKSQTPPESSNDCRRMPVCPVCGGRLVAIRMKSQCERCHTIVETCCEGGPQ